MNKGILLALALLALSACSSGDNNHYYQLPVAVDNGIGRAASADAAHPVWVERINLSDFLAGSGVVYQSSDVRYITASNNLWASPLEQQLQQAMVVNLSNALPGFLVSASPAATGEQDRLEINVSGFHGRYDGQVVIQGVALLTHRQQVMRYPFALTLKQEQDGYEALVKTLGQGWLQVSQNIARQISAAR